MAMPLTPRKRLDDNHENMAEAGQLEKTTGQEGLASQEAALKREHPNNATKNHHEQNPQETGKRRSTMNAVCKCFKVCKNRTGLKVHQTKMGCLRNAVLQAQCQYPVQELVRWRRIQARKHSPQGL